MKRFTSILMLVAMVGCASKPAAVVLVPGHSSYEGQLTSAALVFDPPVTRGMPELDLSRDGREASAFGGFQQATTSYSYVRTDDRQSTAYLNSYDRQTYTVQIGTTTR